MQTTEHDEQQRQAAPAEPYSQPLPLVVPVQKSEDDDDPDHIFIRAVAEIDTQPLPTRKRTGTTPLADILELCFLMSVLCFGLVGMTWLCITYPHTLVIVYAKATPARITATLHVSTRTLPPITLTRSATAPTTGHGHQDARAATGTLMFYNGSATPQYVPSDSVFTGHDGVKVTTEQSSTVPAANLPAIGSTTVPARTMLAGSHGNIAAFDVDLALSSVLKVRNEAAFTNGHDARDYHTVASQDLHTVTSTVNERVTQAFTNAFSLQQGEEAIPTNCHVVTSANHQIGQEAPSVTLTAAKACSAVAYKSQQVERQATATFEQTRPAATYHLVGSVQTTVQSGTPLVVTISGKWVYTFSPDYQQLLAEQIAGDSPAKARAALLKIGVIAYVSVPSTLPAAMYINFLVLIG